MSNAIKYTSKGYISISHEVIDKGILKFTVEDTGQGIPKEIIDKLGHPFATFNDSSGHNPYGVGLGLSISKQLVGELGPTKEITVTS